MVGCRDGVREEGPKGLTLDGGVGDFAHDGGEKAAGVETKRKKRT